MTAALPLFQPAGAPSLRPYQQKNVTELLACLQRGESPLYVLPTGGGKTQVLCSITGETIQHGWEVGIFVHRVELLRQASARLTSMGIPHGVIAPGSDLTSHRVHVASIDTVGSRIHSLAPWLRRLRLAIPDEAHHAVATKWDRVLQLPRQRMGVTATPCRTDGRGLGETGLFGRLVRGPSIRALTSAGYLAEARVYAPPVALDLSGVRKRGGDFALGQLAAAVDTDAITAEALRWYDRIAMPWIMRGLAPPPAVAFCTTVAHAEHVADAFCAHGVLARSVDGSMRSAERDAAIGGLADGSVQVLTSCDLIGEGLDIPAVAAAILLRPTESTSLYLQQPGRALRPHEDKSHAVILDFAGNTARHGMYDADRDWDLKGGLRGKERAVAATWRCRKCHRVYSRPNEFAVMSCGCGAKQQVNGFAPAHLDNHPKIAGLAADVIMAMPYKDAVKACKTLPDLEAYGKLKGYKPGWAFANWQHRREMQQRFRPRGRR